ncbi:isochorismatase family protein [Telmatospirillum sp.]|uniref:isochorismatase family protein n=1 Tax=Telmatospirillum sp. TaxID=2079197 RepID=UPI00284C3165|nr:isochorismatase family protein [Telmatospirillum sp.]MDR3436924.1 isochorismatase family protein [Telmatospirillum sp.]
MTNFTLADLPVSFAAFDAGDRPVGLVIVDEVNGFATPGQGPLAPPGPDSRIDQMVSETGRLARLFDGRKQPILLFLDSHQPGKAEPPYPPHCEIGSGQEDLVPALAWLEHCSGATMLRKDCINGFVGAIDPQTGRNAVVDWVNGHSLAAVVVVGICTDICVMDFVLTLLSARNHGLMPGLIDVVVHEPGCATYDLPRSVVDSLGYPATATHPRDLTHHMGLYLMASRGAVLVSSVI